MRPNSFQKLLSHFKDVYLETASSDYNEVLHVVLNRGRFQLLTENAIYSFGDLYSNYKRAFERVNIGQMPIENVLILGLGLGSIPFMLEKNFKQSYNYTAVEIDESVIYLAHKYVTQYLKSPLEVIQADAYSYVMLSDEVFDLICIDIFIDDEVPHSFEQIDFLEKVQQLLAPNGILMYNRLSLTSTDKRRTSDFFTGTFKKVFQEGDYMDVGGNWILTNVSNE